MAFGEALKQDWNGQLGWISLDLVGLAMFIISFWAGAEFLKQDWNGQLDIPPRW